MKKQIFILMMVLLTVIPGACAVNKSEELDKNADVQNTEQEMAVSGETESTDSSEFLEEQIPESTEQLIEETCEIVRSMNFEANEPHLDITPEENQLYLEAYLKILKNELPIYGYESEEEPVYYRDLWMNGIELEYEDLLENRVNRRFRYLYYYDDLDGDGKPEFATNQGCLYIFNYELGDDSCRILYREQSCYLKKLIGAGQIWYRDGQHAGVLRNRLVIFSEENDGEIVLDLEEGYHKPYFYEVGVYEYEPVYVGKEQWDEITAPFFEMAENHEIPELTLEEVFGGLLKEEEPEDDKNYEMDWNWEGIEIDADDGDTVSIGKNIEYPYLRLEMSENYEILSRINALIEQDAENHCDGESNYYGLEYGITYLSDDYVSILYQGTMMHVGSAHPNDIAWGTTIDMRTGEMVSIEEIIALPELEKKLEQTGLDTVRGYDADTYREEMERNLYDEYLNYKLEADDENHYHDYYLKQDKIGVLFGVSHAIGNYMIVEFDR